VIPYFVPDFRVKKINLAYKDYFLFVGRLSEEKGIIQLLEILKNIPLNLIVIGDGPLKDQVSSYGKFPNIRILNYCSRPEVLHYMSNAFCSIIPSRWFETGPLVMLESLCMGTPVIVPNIGSFKEIITSDDFGYRYNHKDFLSLKNKIELMWRNRKIWSQRKKEIKKYFYEKYSEKSHYDNLMDAYHKVLSVKNSK